MTGVRFVPPYPYPFRPALATALTALLLCACAPRPQAPLNAPLVSLPLPPANAPAVTAPLPSGPSMISMPLAVDLEAVAADAARALPRPLLRRLGRLPVPLRRRSLQASVSQDAGSCSVTGLDCLARQSVLTVAAEAPASGEAERIQDWRLRRLALVMDGPRLELQAQLEVQVASRLPEGAHFRPGDACSGKGGRIEWRQAVYPSWGPAGNLVLGVGPWSWRGRTPCPGPDGEPPSELAEMLAGAVLAQLRGRLGGSVLLGRLARAWPELNAARELRAGVWLLPHPGQVRLTPLAGQGGELRTALLVEARPEIRHGGRPFAPLPPVPTPLPGEGPVAALHLALRGDIGLAAAEAQLARRLVPVLRRVNGRRVRLQGVRLWGNGGEAVLALSFATPALAEVYLLARPAYDPLRNEVVFRDLAFLPDSRRYLARAAPWLDHRGLLAALAAEARLGFDPALAGAMNGVRELHEAAGQGLTLHGGLRQVRPQALYFTEDRLVALVLLEGRLALEATRR